MTKPIFVNGKTLSHRLAIVNKFSDINLDLADMHITQFIERLHIKNKSKNDLEQMAKHRALFIEHANVAALLLQTLIASLSNEHIRTICVNDMENEDEHTNDTEESLQ